MRVDWAASGEDTVMLMRVVFSSGTASTCFRRSLRSWMYRGVRLIASESRSTGISRKLLAARSRTAKLRTTAACVAMLSPGDTEMVSTSRPTRVVMRSNLTTAVAW